VPLTYQSERRGPWQAGFCRGRSRYLLRSSESASDLASCITIFDRSSRFLANLRVSPSCPGGNPRSEQPPARHRVVGDSLGGREYGPQGPVPYIDGLNLYYRLKSKGWRRRDDLDACRSSRHRRRWTRH
jgi:hypothetical protein